MGLHCGHILPLASPIRDRVLQNVPRALKPGGYFVLEAYTPQQLEYKTGGPPAAEMMYSRQILQDAFEGHLEIVRNQEVVREVVEGSTTRSGGSRPVCGTKTKELIQYYVKKHGIK